MIESAIDSLHLHTFGALDTENDSLAMCGVKSAIASNGYFEPVDDISSALEDKGIVGREVNLSPCRPAMAGLYPVNSAEV